VWGFARRGVVEALETITRWRAALLRPPRFPTALPKGSTCHSKDSDGQSFVCRYWRRGRLLGSAVGLRLSEEGCDVVIVDLDEARANTTAEFSLPGKGRLEW